MNSDIRNLSKELKDVVFISSFSKNCNLVKNIKFDILFIIPIFGLIYFYIFFYLKNVKINRNIFNMKQNYISSLVVFYSKILLISLFIIVILGFTYEWLFFGITFNHHYLFLIIILFIYINFHLFTLFFFIKRFNFYISFLKNDYQKLTNKYINLMITKSEILEYEKKIVDLDCELLKEILFSKEENFFLDNKNVNYKSWKKFVKKLGKSDKEYMFWKASVQNSSIFDRFKSIYVTNLYISSSNKWLIKISILNSFITPLFLVFAFSCFYLNFGYFDFINGNLIYTLLSAILSSLIFVLFLFGYIYLIKKYFWQKKYETLTFLFKSFYVKMLINKSDLISKQNDYINNHFFNAYNLKQISINKIDLQKDLLKKLKIVISTSKIFRFYGKEYPIYSIIWSLAGVAFAILVVVLPFFSIHFFYSLNFLIYQNFSWNTLTKILIIAIVSSVILFLLVMIYQISSFLIVSNLISINYLCDTCFVYPVTVKFKRKWWEFKTRPWIITKYLNNEYGKEIRKNLKNANQNFDLLDYSVYLQEIISFKELIENKGIDWIETNELDNIYFSKNYND